MIPVKILAILLLVGAVIKFGHPLRAAIVLGAITAGLALVGGSILLGVTVTIAGVAALILFG